MNIENQVITTTTENLSAAFTLWAERYANDPDSFTDVLDSNGKPVTDYGERCAAYLTKILRESGQF